MLIHTVIKNPTTTKVKKMCLTSAKDCKIVTVKHFCIKQILH